MTQQYLESVNQWLFWAVIALQALDVISTNLALKYGGREANKLVARVMAVLGRLWHVPKVLVAVGGAWVAKTYGDPMLAVIGMAGICALYVWVVFFNNVPIVLKLRGAKK